MSLAQVAPCNIAFGQPALFNLPPVTLPQMWFPSHGVKRSGESQMTDPNADSNTGAASKVRRTAVMHSVHDVGSALHSLNLNSKRMSEINSSDLRNTSDLFGEYSDVEPQTPMGDLDKDQKQQQNSGTAGDEDDSVADPLSETCNAIMDSALFANKISSCSKVMVAKDTVRSARDVLRPNSNGLTGDAGALIVYRAPTEVIEESMVRAARAHGAARAAVDAAYSARQMAIRIAERANKYREAAEMNTDQPSQPEITIERNDGDIGGMDLESSALSVSPMSAMGPRAAPVAHPPAAHGIAIVGGHHLQSAGPVARGPACDEEPAAPSCWAAPIQIPLTWGGGHGLATSWSGMEMDFSATPSSLHDSYRRWEMFAQSLGEDGSQAPPPTPVTRYDGAAGNMAM